MAKYIFITVLILLSGNCTNAQFDIPEINRLKDIKPLESSTFDVQRLLVEFKSDGWDPNDYRQYFLTENYSIEIYYSSGRCSEDDEIWNAPEWKVTKIEIEPDELKVKDLGFDFTKFKKEQIYAGQSKRFIYHDKGKGYAFKVDERDGDIEEIILFPPKRSSVSPCDNETARQFLNYDSWFGDKKLKDREPPGDINIPANVIDVSLSEDELLSIRFNKQIQVTTQASDPENDVLTYNYMASGGKIIGSGAKVIWDLQGVGPGTYTITVGVDDGCGICGKTITKTVTIR